MSQNIWQVYSRSRGRQKALPNKVSRLPTTVCTLVLVVNKREGSLHRSRKKSGGKTAFPTLRLLSLVLMLTIERLSAEDQPSNWKCLSGKEGGLAPALQAINRTA